MSHSLWYGTAALWFLALGACSGATLPDDVVGYASRCTRMNARSIPPYEGDPHHGTKNVYACNLEASVLAANVRPFPEGALLVKESTKEGAFYPWLIATARKQGGAWKWDEYTRNFDDEPFARILASENICTDCHRKVEGADWIFTPFTNRGP